MNSKDFINSTKPNYPERSKPDYANAIFKDSGALENEIIGWQHSAQYPRGALSAAFRTGIAVWGCTKNDNHTVAKLMQLDPDGKVDLVRIGDGRDLLRGVILD